MGEVWKDVIGYEGYYQVSNCGNVRSMHRTFHAKYLKNTPIVKLNGRIRKPYLGKDGYYVVNLKKDGASKTFSIHRLVALHFVGNPQNKKCVDHINTCRTDNRASNLRWVSYKENQNNPITKEHLRNSKLGNNHPQYGKKQSKEYIEKRVCTLRHSACCKPVIQLDLNGEVVNEYHSLSEAKRQIGYSPWKAIKHNKVLNGYKWRYK